MNDIGQGESYASLAWYTLAAVGIAFLIRFFIAAPYVVEGASMENTFHTLDYLIIDKLSYELGNPERGDVIVMLFPYDTTRTFIKRVIGLPGETVTLQGATVTISNDQFPNGFTLSEPYVDSQNQSDSNMTVHLGADEYFVLGDNRRASADSRSWGVLPRKDIIGRAFIRLYPFGQIGVYPGEARYNPGSTSVPQTQ